MKVKTLAVALALVGSTNAISLREHQKSVNKQEQKSHNKDDDEDSAPAQKDDSSDYSVSNLMKKKTETTADIIDDMDTSVQHLADLKKQAEVEEKEKLEKAEAARKEKEHAEEIQRELKQAEIEKESVK